MKICGKKDQKITNSNNKQIKKQCGLDLFLGFESIGYIEPSILLCAIYMDSVILL